MIGQMMKKQALLMLRSPMELLLLFGLPVILITILGTALASFMDTDAIEIELDIALVTNESETIEMEQFITDFEASGAPPESVTEIAAAAQSMSPRQTLMEIFRSEDLAEMVQVTEIAPADKLEIIDSESYHAVIEFPENFTYDFLYKVFLDGVEVPAMHVYYDEEEAIASSVVNQILTSFQEQYTLAVFIGENNIDAEELALEETAFKKESATLDRLEPITSKSYYTIGMVVMNVLFMAAAMSTISFDERRSLVFNRMILANMSRWTYFLSVLFSGTVLAFIQMMFVFGYSYIVFDVTWSEPLSFLLISVVFSLAVGGLAVLLTAISFQTNSERVITLFSNIVVVFFAFLGGSFFPIGDFSPLIQTLGELTPNGAAMAAYIGIIRGEELAFVSHHLLYIFLFAVISIIIAVFMFPKRGVAS